MSEQQKGSLQCCSNCTEALMTAILNFVMQAIEEQGLRQSYGSDPSRSHRINGGSVSSIEHDTAALGSVPRRLSTIVSGVSASGTPSAAEMHSLQSQVQHLP